MKHDFFFFTNTTCWRWKIVHLMLFLVPANGWFQDLDICSIWWYSVLPAHVIEFRITMSRWNEFHGIYIVGQKMWTRLYSLTGCNFFFIFLQKSNDNETNVFSMEYLNATGFVSNKRGKTGEIICIWYCCCDWAEQVKFCSQFDAVLSRYGLLETFAWREKLLP